MKKLRWQILVVVLALAAIAVLLIGQQPALVIPGVEPAPVQPSEGGVYTEALVGSLVRLNPLLDFYNSADRSVDRLLYSALLKFDDRGQPYGDLAETWGISQNGEVYNFSIRQNAVWHDGQPVTSSDVQFTIDLMKDENIPVPPDLREFWSQIDVVTLDDKTLQFRLPEPFAPFLDYLTFGVLPEHLLGGIPSDQLVNAPFNLNPVGSGPFKFQRMIVENGQVTGVELEAFQDYYNKPPFFNQAVFRYFPDDQSALAAYQQEEVLGLGQVTQSILPAALRDDGLGLYTGRIPRLGLVYLNLQDSALPFFQDVNLRRALLMGLNRQKIIDRQLGSQALIANGPILQDTWAYYDGIEQIPFDPERANEIIKEAGYSVPSEGGSVRVKEGVRFEFELLFPDQAPYHEIAQSIKDDWSQLGVGVVLKPVPAGEMVSSYLGPGNYQAALAELNLGRTPDPDPYPFWHQSQINGGQNYSKWDDRQASEFLEQARIKVDPSERLNRYQNFQIRFTNQMPALPLYNLVWSFGVDKQVQGVRSGPVFDPSDRFSTITDWFLVATRGGEQTANTPTAP
jgi:peptide/nickel transport system substrate-binding protein